MTAPLTRHAVWRHTGLLAAKRDPNLTEVYVRDVSLGYQSSCSELCQEPEAEAQSRHLWQEQNRRSDECASIPDSDSGTAALERPRCAVFAELSDAQKEALCGSLSWDAGSTERFSVCARKRLREVEVALSGVCGRLDHIEQHSGAIIGARWSKSLEGRLQHVEAALLTKPSVNGRCYWLAS